MACEPTKGQMGIPEHLIEYHNWKYTLFISQIKYTAYRDRSHEERVVRFQTEIRDGQAHIVSIELLKKIRYFTWSGSSSLELTSR